MIRSKYMVLWVGCRLRERLPSPKWRPSQVTIWSPRHGMASSSSTSTTALRGSSGAPSSPPAPPSSTGHVLPDVNEPSPSKSTNRGLRRSVLSFSGGYTRIWRRGRGPGYRRRMWRRRRATRRCGCSSSAAGCTWTCTTHVWRPGRRSLSGGSCSCSGGSPVRCRTSTSCSIAWTGRWFRGPSDAAALRLRSSDTVLRPAITTSPSRTGLSGVGMSFTNWKSVHKASPVY